MPQDSTSIAAPPQLLPVRGVLPIGAIWQHIIWFARKKPLGAFGAVVAVLLIIVAIFAPLIATHDPNATNSALVFAPPGSEYWLGGDQIGRDVFSRLVYGARISLYAGLLSAFIGASIGMMVGVTSVHFGGIDRPGRPANHRCPDGLPAAHSGHLDHGRAGRVAEQRRHRPQHRLHSQVLPGSCVPRRSPSKR